MNIYDTPPKIRDTINIEYDEEKEFYLDLLMEQQEQM